MENLGALSIFDIIQLIILVLAFITLVFVVRSMYKYRKNTEDDILKPRIENRHDT